MKSAYKSGVSVISEHLAMLNQVSEEGNYWKVLDDAAEKEIMSQSFHCLSEVLLDFTIKEVISQMFGVKKDPDIWNESIKAYAIGN